MAYIDGKEILFCSTASEGIENEEELRQDIENLKEALEGKVSKIKSIDEHDLIYAEQSGNRGVTGLKLTFWAKDQIGANIPQRLENGSMQCYVDDDIIAKHKANGNDADYFAANVGYVDKKIADNVDYIDKKIASLVDSAPETLDTLGELAEALNNSDAGTVLGELSKKADQEYVDTKLATKVPFVARSKKRYKVFLVRNEEDENTLGIVTRDLRYKVGANDNATDASSEIPLRLQDGTMCCNTPDGATVDVVANVGYVGKQINEVKSIVANNYISKTDGLTKTDGFYKKWSTNFNYTGVKDNLTLSNGIYYIIVTATREKDSVGINFTLNLSVTSGTTLCCSTSANISFTAALNAGLLNFFAEYNTTDKKLYIYKQVVSGDASSVSDITVDSTIGKMHDYSNIKVNVIRISE